MKAKNKEYYIYYVPGLKIGCTVNIQSRTRQQNIKSYEILEIHTDIYLASNREIELQKQYNLPVDTIPYWKAYKNRVASRTIEGSIKGGHSQGIINSNNGHLDKVRNPSAGGKISSSITKECPHCKHIGKMPSIFRHHFNNCKSITIMSSTYVKD